MSPSAVAITMFASMLVLLLSGQRVFGAIGFVGVVAALLLWGTGGQELPFNQAITVMNWYPLLTVPRAGARRMLQQVIEAEVETFLAAHVELEDAHGRRRVVRNGHAPAREIQTGIGPIAVRRPRVRDRGDGFEVDDVPEDRLGVRASILGRMARHGGGARVRRREDGTEVELTLPPLEGEH